MKRILSVLLAALLLLSLAACGAPAEIPETQTTGTTETKATLNKITVIVVHADGSEKTFSYETDEEFLGTLLQDEGLITGEMGQYGLMISEVDGEKAVYEENGAYWALYENGEYAMQGIDTTKIKDGGEYKLEYTK